MSLRRVLPMAVLALWLVPLHGQNPEPTAPAAPAAVVNAASYMPAIAPGSLISIFGTNLAGAAVTVNGFTAPELYTSSTQINAQLPFEVQPGTATLRVGSSTRLFMVAPAAPGIFKLQGERAALEPARPGDYVTIWLTGQGPVDPPVATGAPAPASPLSWAVLPVAAAVGGLGAEVQYAGLAPGFLGLMQINLRLPDLPAGDQPVVVTIGGAASTIAMIPVAGTQQTPASLTSDFTPPQGRGCPLDVRGGPCGKRLMSARSPDGLTFTRTNRIVADRGDVPDVVVDPRGWIYLYYVGATGGTETNRLAVAVSSDNGGSWVYKRAILDGFAGMSDPVDPDIQILPDGTFRLYVTAALPGEHVRSWYAEGTDGIRFQRKGIAFDPPGEPLDPSTILINGTWHIFAGGNTPTPGANWHGTSADGTLFTFDAEKLFLNGGTHAVSNGLAVPGGFRFYAFTHQPPPVINSFFTTDGATWTAEPGTRLRMDASTGLESAGVKDAAVARLADGSYFMIYVTEIGEISAGQPTQQVEVQRAYLMALHACDKATTNCGDPRNHQVYLAESDDGVAWNLVQGWTPYSGSVPDVIRRGNTFYVFAAGQNPLVRARLDSGTVEAPAQVLVEGLTEGFVDPSLIVDDQGRLVLFFLYGRFGGDPAGCPAGQATCTQRFGSATEVAGSDGTRFTLDAGDRVTLSLGGAGDPRSASDPDVFFDGGRYVLYISHGTSTSVWTSADLRGAYRKIADLSASTGGVASGHFDTAAQRYWTYAHVLKDGATVIRRAVHPDLSRLLGETDWQTVMTGPSLGFSATTNVESPGFAVSGVKR